MDFFGWQPYVSVAERRRKAMREIEKHRKKDQQISPVTIKGRVIAATFWGKSWCRNLESYSDYSNRLPRGRTYVRNGAVVDLQIKPGLIQALVSGSELYRVTLKIKPAAGSRWKSLCKDCAGAIDSLVELLRGQFSAAVMERICRQREGLFPAPSEIGLDCSCPDGARMCKHVAAVLYGVGARLDHQPELIFRLRGVDEKDLIAGAANALPQAKHPAASKKVLAGEDLADIFGLDMAGLDMADSGGESVKKKTARKTTAKKASVKKTTAKKATAKKAVAKTKALPTVKRKSPGK